MLGPECVSHRESPGTCRNVLATKEERHVYRRRNSHDSAHHPADLPARVEISFRGGYDAAAEREHVRNELTGLRVEPVRTHRRRALGVRTEGSADVAVEPRRSSSRPGCEAAEGSARSSGRTARRRAPVPCHTGCIARTPSHRSRREPSDGQTATAVRDVSNGSRRRPTRPPRYAICGVSSSSSSWMEPCTANCQSWRHCSIRSASA